MMSKQSSINNIEIVVDEEVEAEIDEDENKPDEKNKLDVSSDIHINSLLDLNKKALHDKLTKVKSQKLKSGKVAYRANDIIEILSSNKERDKRLINDYTADEIIIIKSNCNGYMRNTRFFTPIGIARYLLEGKIFAYGNACIFFNIKPQNMEHIKWQKQLTDMQVKSDEVDAADIDIYSTKPILKWLFDKRKSCKLLGDSTTIADVLALFSTDRSANQKKIEYLKGLV